MAHSFNPRPGLDLKEACKERGCTIQDLINNALESYLANDRTQVEEKIKKQQPKEEPVQANEIKYTKNEVNEVELPNNKAKSSPLVTTIHD